MPEPDSGRLIAGPLETFAAFVAVFRAWWLYLLAGFFVTIYVLGVATARGPCGHRFVAAIFSAFTGYC